MKVTLKAFAKLNLTLDITGLKENGYHLIETVFQSVSLFDTVSVSNDTDRIAVLCGKNLSGEQNICFSAAKAPSITPQRVAFIAAVGPPDCATAKFPSLIYVPPRFIYTT